MGDPGPAPKPARWTPAEAPNSGRRNALANCTNLPAPDLGMSPGHRARKKGATRAKPRPVPRFLERRSGWDDLVDEIAASSLRINIARGGNFAEDVVKPVGPCALADPNESAQAVWESYRVDEEKVDDNVLQTIWHRSLDAFNRKNHPEPVLPRLPRMSLDRRQTEPLPTVRNLEFCRDAKRRHREDRERGETLQCHAELKAQMRYLFGDIELPALPRIAGSRHIGVQEAPVEEAETPASTPTPSSPPNGSSWNGALRSPRRNALDGSRDMPSVASDDKRKHMTGLMDRLRRRAAEQGGEPPTEQELLRVTQRVRQRCERKLTRMRLRFLRKQGSLNQELRSRVQRLQSDRGDALRSKMTTIVPSQSLGGPSPSYFLLQHGRATELARQVMHVRYVSQVDGYHYYVWRLADPGRTPERGEMYLCDAFRIVLSAGLLVDSAFFFRALRFLEGQDLESPATVNLLAAFMEVFRVNSREYMSFLGARQVPIQAPLPRETSKTSYFLGLPWHGVTLGPLEAEPRLAPVLPPEEELPFDRTVPSDSSDSGSDAEDEDGRKRVMLERLLRQCITDIPILSSPFVTTKEPPPPPPLPANPPALASPHASRSPRGTRRANGALQAVVRLTNVTNRLKQQSPRRRSMAAEDEGRPRDRGSLGIASPRGGGNPGKAPTLGTIMERPRLEAADVSDSW